MITGFNTDIKHNETVFHIQTEDKGSQNPYIESLVYVGGEILASKKTSYAEKLEGGMAERDLGQLMEHQHRTMIAAIKRGKFDSLLKSGKGKTITQSGAKTVANEPKPPAVLDRIDEEKTLDQVIMDYLAAEAESEHLELSLLNPCEFVSGQPIDLRIQAKKSISQGPIPEASIEMKMISTMEPPRVLFRGNTGPDGIAHIRCGIPSFREGTAAVIISAHSSIGNDEVKQLIKRRK